jgi:hypothetical protein
MTKTNAAERMREYRKRKALVQAESTKAPKVPKTGAERVREYRARKSAEQPSTSTASPPLSSQRFQTHSITNQRPSTSSARGSSTVSESSTSTATYQSKCPAADKEFTKRFLDEFGHVCSICDRLWFKKRLLCSLY